MLATPDVTERLLRPGEVCQRLGISYSTLARWVREGRIRAIRTAGGKYRVPESEVRRIAEGLQLKASSFRAGMSEKAYKGSCVSSVGGVSSG